MRNHQALLPTYPYPSARLTALQVVARTVEDAEIGIYDPIANAITCLRTACEFQTLWLGQQTREDKQ